MATVLTQDTGTSQYSTSETLPSLKEAAVNVALSAASHLASTSAQAASVSSTGEPSSELAGTMNYFFDNILGLDQHSKLVEVSARQGISKTGTITLDLNLVAGEWPKELVDALSSIKIFSKPIDFTKYVEDKTYQITVQDDIKKQIDKFVTKYVDLAVGQVDGVEHAIAASAGGALKNLLGSKLTQSLAGEIADSLLDFDLPEKDKLKSIFRKGLDEISGQYFKDFLPDVAKTYAKLGLNEILTAVTAGSSPGWAAAIHSVGDGIFDPILNNLVNNYFQDGTAPSNIFDGVKFAETLGNAVANLLVDFDSLDSKIIDDILGIDGHGFIESKIGDLRSEEHTSELQSH